MGLRFRASRLLNPEPQAVNPESMDPLPGEILDWNFMSFINRFRV